MVPENVHIIFVSVDLLLKGHAIREEGTILVWFPKPGFNLHSYHTIRGVACLKAIKPGRTLSPSEQSYRWNLIGSLHINQTYREILTSLLTLRLDT